MRRLKIIFTLLSLIIVISCEKKQNSTDSGGDTPVTSYYIDATSGSDSSSGTSSFSPWKTLAKVSAQNFSSGITVYLKKGETWYEELTIPSSNITIDAYGSGVAPTIDGSQAMSTSWTNEGGSIYSQAVTLPSGGGLGNVSANGSLLNFVAWNTDFNTTLSGAATGSYSYNNSTNTVYVKSASNPSGSTYRASVRLYGVNVVSKSSVSVKNIKITRFSLHGIQFKNCNTCVADFVNVTNGGGAVVGPNGASYLYAGNGIEVGNSSTSSTIKNSIISQIFDSGISPQTYSSNQTISNVFISNNSVDKCGFAGIEVSVLSNGGTTGSVMSGVTISGNTVSNSGTGFTGRRNGTEGHGIRVIADFGAGSMSSVSLSNNTVSGSAGDGLKISGQIGTVNISRLKSTANQYGVNATDSNATNMLLSLSSSLIYANNSWGVVYNAPSAGGFQLFHNTFYNNTTINFGVSNHTGVAKLQNNLFSASAAMTHFYAASAIAGLTCNNNCYTNLANMFGYNGSAYSTVSLFNGATGFEAAGLGGTVGMTDPANGDFRLTSGSQCKTLGVSSLGVTTDYAGNGFLSTPSSGAYQY